MRKFLFVFMAPFLFACVAKTQAQTEQQEIGLIKPVLATADIEGEWSGVLPGGFGGYKISITATKEGAKYEIKGLTSRCEMIMYPTSTDGTFDSFISGGKCQGDEKISLQWIDDKLEIPFPSSNQAAILTHISGPLATDPTFTVPVAFRNIALGMKLDEIDGVVEGSPNITSKRNLAYDLQPASLGWGVSELPFLEVDYRSVHYPVQASGEPEQDEDNIAAYAISGQIIALLRSYHPALENQTSLTSFKQAVLERYSSPSIEERDGWQLQWHYLSDGTQLDEDQARELCISKDSYNDTLRTDSRQIGMQYHASDMDTQYIEQSTYTLRPIYGCGTSIIFSIGGKTDGTMTSLQSIAFIHEPVASAIWASRKSSIESEIARYIADRTQRDNNTPKL